MDIKNKSIAQHDKEEGEKQNARAQDKGIARTFCFASQDIVDCVIGFKISSHTIKDKLKVHNG